MEIENTENFEELLLTVITKVSSEPVSLLFVDDIYEWCASRCGENKGNPIAKALRDSNTKEAAILLRKNISDEKYQGVIGRMIVGGQDSVSEKLNTAEAFLIHTVLHELAHLLNNWGQDKEDDCDSWAFERLNEISI